MRNKKVFSLVLLMCLGSNLLLAQTIHSKKQSRFYITLTSNAFHSDAFDIVSTSMKEADLESPRYHFMFNSLFPSGSYPRVRSKKVLGPGLLMGYKVSPEYNISAFYLPGNKFVIEGKNHSESLFLIFTAILVIIGSYRVNLNGRLISFRICFKLT